VLASNAASDAGVSVALGVASAADPRLELQACRNCFFLHPLAKDGIGNHPALPLDEGICWWVYSADIRHQHQGGMWPLQGVTWCLPGNHLKQTPKGSRPGSRQACWRNQCGPPAQYQAQVSWPGPLADCRSDTAVEI